MQQDVPGSKPYETSTSILLPRASWTWRWSARPVFMMSTRRRCRKRSHQNGPSFTNDISTSATKLPFCNVGAEHSGHGVDASLGFLKPRNRRGTDTPKSWRKSVSIGVIKVVALTFMWSQARAADITTDYLKPTVSSKECMETVELIAAKTKGLGNNGACMQCNPATNVCPPGCQALIDNLYLDCDGVITPDGLYFDPSNKINGQWSNGVKAAIKIATERCGCNRAGRLEPIEATIFGASNTRYLNTKTRLVLTTLVALAVSMVTYYLLLS